MNGSGVPADGGPAAPVRIAMWSGPRNLSTALMRSFGNRPDTVVVDEPFYAHYLAVTGIDHPGRDEIVRTYPTDWRDVVAALQAPLPAGKRVAYQKQMAHHLLPTVGRDWLAGVRHAFLIRNPSEVVASYARVRARPTLDDLGIVQQVELHRAYGGPVVDATDLSADPAGLLTRLCSALGIRFDPAMLRWPPGPRATDGIWARHWYDSVYRSTGFAGPRNEALPSVPPRLQPLVDRCRPLYQELHESRLRT